MESAKHTAVACCVSHFIELPCQMSFFFFVCVFVCLYISHRGLTEVMSAVLNSGGGNIIARRVSHFIDCHAKHLFVFIFVGLLLAT